MFEVRASYLRGAIERSASVRAETPEQAAALAVWRGYLPLYFESSAAEMRPVFWDAAARPPRRWPVPVARYVVSDDHACVHFATDEGQPLLLVEAKALA